MVPTKSAVVRGSSSVVERLPSKQDVASSSLVSRSTFPVIRAIARHASGEFPLRAAPGEPPAGPADRAHAPNRERAHLPRQGQAVEGGPGNEPGVRIE